MGSPSRRDVLRLAAAGAGGLVIAGTIAFPAAAGAQSAPSTLAEFTPYVNTRFDVQVGALRTTALTLVEASVIEPRSLGRPVTGEAFSLLFAGKTQVPTGGAVYTVRHRQLGAFSMFLASVGLGRNGPRYEAVYNHHTIG